MKTVDDYAVLVLAAIRADQAAGVVPAGVGSFGELDGYVDANEYLVQSGAPWGSDAGSGEYGFGTWNAVVTLVNEALSAG